MQQLLETAVEIAHEAGALIRTHYQKRVQVSFKGAVNPVTETDTAAEALITSRLNQAFPDHHILGEEAGGSDWRTQSPIWIIDPLDGTNNYAHGLPHFSVSIGLFVDGEPAVGVVYDPLREDTFTAWRGGGAWHNGQRVTVNRVDTLANALMATGFPYVRRVAAFNNVQFLDVILRRCQGVRRSGSAALDLAYVACGRFAGYWEPFLSTWDLAAGVLLVTEAGGRITDFTGTQTRLYSGEEVVATNGAIHDEFLAVIKAGAAAPHPDYPVLA